VHTIILVVISVLLGLWSAPIQAQCDQCKGDFNGDGQVTVNEILVSVNNALNDCPAPGPRFIDNGDGTVTDTKTGLLWEKKSADASIHDQDGTYTWSTGSPFNPDGTAFTSLLATLNQPPCFAGHCDWRLPSVTELQSLVDYGRFAPAIDPVFNTACAPGCAVVTCSCTGLDYYWSVTTPADVGIPDNAWSVDFNYGYLNLFDKTLPAGHVRAVRGGL
jgi:hypothetical protein